MNIKTSLKILIGTLLTLFCLTWYFNAIGQAATYSDKRVVVSTKILIDSFHELNTSKDQYTIHAIIMELWNDPTQAFKSDNNNPKIYTITPQIAQKLSSMWYPNLQILHTTSLPNNLYNHLFIYPNGNVKLSQDFSAKINNSFPLQNIPFDKPTLNFAYTSYTWNINKLVFTKPQLHIVSLHRLNHQGWKLNNIVIKSSTMTKSGMAYPYSTINIAFQISRNSLYFIFRYILPNIIIVMISWLSFIMKSERIHLAIGCLIGIVAYQVFMTTQTPHVGYLTALDYFFVWSSLCIAAVVARSAADMRREQENLPTSRLAKIQYFIIPVTYILGYTALFLILKLYY